MGLSVSAKADGASSLMRLWEMRSVPCQTANHYLCVCVLLKAGVYTSKGPRRVSRSDPKGDKVSASDQECWQGSYRAPSAPLSCWIIDGLSQHSLYTHTHTHPSWETHTHSQWSITPIFPSLWRWLLLKFKYHSGTHGRHSPPGRRFNEINTKHRHSETVQLRLRLILFTPPSLFLSSAGFWNHRAAGQ